MAILRNLGDRIEGRKIICQFKKHTGPHRVSTRGAHNAQMIRAEGNPAFAVVDKVFEWVEKTESVERA